jgi:PAS domain S-box-containing protein
MRHAVLEAASMPLAQLELLTATLAAAEIGGWSLELASQRLCWTAGIFQIHGLTAGEPPSVEATLAYYPPEARAIVKQAMARAAATGESWDLEVPLVTAQNRAIWVRSSGQAIRKDGDIVHLAGALQDVTARHEMMASAERLSELAAQMTNAVIMTDAEGCADWVNDAFTRLTSYTLEDMQGRKPGTLLQGPDTDPQTIRHIQECLQRGEGFDVEILNYTRERQSYWTAIICTPLRSKAGILTGFLSVQSNVTSRRRAEEETRQERRRVEALLRDVLDSLPIAVSVYDPCERLILTNRCFTGTFPVLAQFAVPGATLEDITGSGLRAGQFPQGAGTVEQQQAWLAETLKTMRQGSGIRTLQLSDGRFVQARETRSADGNLICVRTDMTELKRAEVALRVQAEQDALTRLGNRTALVRALERMLKPGLDGACRGGALVMLDVDYFKQVNDSLGHDAGDALLVELASRLRDATRGGDTPARLGGDEFAILFPGLFNDSGAAAA